MLKLKNVSKYYAKDGVISSGFTKVNLELHLGEFVVITGESGSGKSTLLNVLSGLDSYEDGEMYINGEETSHYTENDYLAYRRKYVSNIFQNFNLVNSYTVYQNVELALLMNGKKKKDIKKYVLELIDKVGLSKYKNTVTSKLSGGQKQRVAIARALANDTPIIVADEPTGSLDSKSSKEIIKLLHEISENKLVIVVTHNKSEIEEYATRLIRMHDGRILEDKLVSKINLDRELKEKEVKSISNLNKLRLGIRNTFNLPIKFTLMFIIFLLITVALVTNYGLFQASKYENNTFGYTDYFMEDSDYRVILKKEDGKTFSNLDYEMISSLPNIEKVVENDLLLDLSLGMYGNSYYLYGIVGTDSISKVDDGRLPENENEVVIKLNKDSWYLTYLDDLYAESFTIESYDGNSYQDKINVVGVIYDNEINYYNDTVEFYLHNSLLKKVSASFLEKYYNVSYELNNNYLYDYNIAYRGFMKSDKVQEGEVIVSDIITGYCKDYNCINNKLEITSKNIYVNDTFNFNITNTYNSENAKKILNLSYEQADGYIFINESDYNKIFNNGNYQSSVFVKELKDLDATVKKLNDMGYTTLKLRDAKINDGEEFLRIIKIFELIVTVALIVTLFLISYFIIKIIYKSRNSYYTTLRTLGGTKEVCINILRKELFVLATVAYSMFLIFLCLVNNNIIEFSYLKNITKYLGFSEYIIIYLIQILLSILISNRYGKKIFKSSIIKTYGSDVA